MKGLPIIFCAALLAAFEAPAQSQPAAPAAQPSAPKDAALTEGEVRRINKEQKKITLRHGEIKGLEMPPMTMVFNVRDPALLDQVQVGDKVRFAAEKSADGTFFVTALEKR
ncbi:MAG TPA: copper-binding protein [Burkholderiaceae bacterium]|nr:copper-binding protein [Burkholderiaceae bacterium]